MRGPEKRGVVWVRAREEERVDKTLEAKDTERRRGSGTEH